MSTLDSIDESRAALADEYTRVRRTSEQICKPLAVEDYVVQPCADASPPRWHLGHVTWFFETFVLLPHALGYRPFDPDFSYLFNSYYNSVGERTARPRRGLVTRPLVSEVYRYREAVDIAMDLFFDVASTEAFVAAAPLITLGLHHEQQHQELLCTDILAVLFQAPLFPAYDASAPAPPLNGPENPTFTPFQGGLYEIGTPRGGEGFAFDNEGPRHHMWLQDFRISDDVVTNAEYLQFMADGGYRNPLLWLSDGFDVVGREGWEAPQYWVKRAGAWMQHTLRGLQPLDPLGPVCHVSYYEADAFARWAGRRLPTEAEWEVAADTSGAAARASGLLDDGWLVPARPPVAGDGPRNMVGHLWEWTSSAYQAYPGYRPPAGAIGEYNAKFMCNQMVLRGGSCATPREHVRITYRNFFHPDKRWQFTGIRLCEDA